MGLSGKTRKFGKGEFRMKILALNASYRGAGGQNAFWLKRLFEGASEAGAKCEVVHLAGLEIKRCRACQRCQQPDHYLHCIYAGQDDVEQVFHKMSTADLIIFATPVYVFGMSALLKKLLERLFSTSDTSDLRLSLSGRLFHHIDGQICSKPFVLLACCDNLETDIVHNVVDYFKVYSRFMDAPQVGLLLRNGGKLAETTAEWSSPAIEAISAAYIQAGRELAQKGFISRRTQRKANQEIIPVPGFHLLMRLNFKPLKRVFLKKAREMQEKAGRLE